MQTIRATPTGRRKITEKMLAARAARPGSWEGVKRGLAMSTAKRAFAVLGVPSRLRELVDLLAGCTKLIDWETGRPMCWPSTSWLCEAMQLGRSQVKTLIRQAQEWGLLEMRDAPNGHRWGGRQDGGEVEAYGFDLSPILARRDEFEAVAAASAERRREGARLRRQIGALRNQVLSLADLGETIDVPGDWPGIRRQAHQLGAERGDSYDPPMLHQILARLCVLFDSSEQALTPCGPVNMAVETDPMGPENRPPLTPTNQPSFAKAKTKADGPNRPGVLVETANRRDNSTPNGRVQTESVVATDKREGRSGSALRGFLITPDFVLRAVPAFADLVRSRSPDWSELLDAAYVLRSNLGISQHAWAEACLTLGRVEAIATLTVIASRTEGGQVQNPGGLLRRMVELHRRDELRLDRSLFGLADTMKELRPGRRQPSEPRKLSSPMQ